MVTANVVPDLLRNVRSNLNENRSPSSLAAALPHSPIPIGENISGKTNNISIDSLMSSAPMTATPQRYFLEQIGKAATENKGWFQFYYCNILLSQTGFKTTYLNIFYNQSTIQWGYLIFFSYQTMTAMKHHSPIIVIMIITTCNINRNTDT